MKLILILLLLQVALDIEAQNDQDGIVGKWTSSDGARTVRVHKEKGKYKGDIIMSNNPNELGKLILWDLVYDPEAEEWVKGKIRLPDMAHEVDCYIEITKAGSLKITGFHGWRVFGSSQLYYRAN